MKKNRKEKKKASAAPEIKTAEPAAGGGKSSPYMSRGIYGNYTAGMKKTNQKRKERGLQALPIRTFEELHQ